MLITLAKYLEEVFCIGIRVAFWWVLITLLYLNLFYGIHRYGLPILLKPVLELRERERERKKERGKD